MTATQESVTGWCSVEEAQVWDSGNVRTELKSSGTIHERFWLVLVLSDSMTKVWGFSYDADRVILIKRSILLVFISALLACLD